MIERYSVPGKAMLFGEYGVLAGLPALVAICPAHCVDVSLAFCENPRGLSGVCVESAFFSEKSIFIAHAALEALHQKMLPSGLPDTIERLQSIEKLQDREILKACEEVTTHENFSLRDMCFFSALLLPYWPLIRARLCARTLLRVTVHEAFSPAFGLGSSSALLAGVHLGLRSLLRDMLPESWSHNSPSLLSHSKSHRASESLWPALRTSLQLAQGFGSGYDVGIQLTSAWKNGQPRPANMSLWSYWWPGAAQVPRHESTLETGLNPKIEQLIWAQSELPRYGVALATHQYSDTVQTVQTRAGNPRAQEWAQAHGALAENFLREKCQSACVPAFMQASRTIAFSQGILNADDTTPLGRLVGLLTQAEVPFKSMGAGGGDCLWVCATQAQLASFSLRHPVTGKPLEDEVVVDFLSPSGRVKHG